MSYDMKNLTKRQLVDFLSYYRSEVVKAHLRSLDPRLPDRFLDGIPRMTEEAYDALYDSEVARFQERGKRLKAKAGAVCEEALSRINITTTVTIITTARGRINIQAVCPACKQAVNLNDAFYMVDDAITMKCPNCGAIRHD